MRYVWRSLLVAMVLAVSVLAVSVLAVSVLAAPVSTTAATTALPATWRRAQVQPDNACAAKDRSRFADCQSGYYSWNIREGDPLTGPVIGTADVAFTISERLDGNSRTWRAQYIVYVLSLTGAATAGTTAAVVPECGGGCTAQGGVADNGAPIAPNQTLSGDVSFSSGGTGRSTSTQSINVFLFHPSAAGVGATQGDPRSTLGPVRCDSASPAEGFGALGRPGCAMSQTTPTFALSSPEWGGAPTPEHDRFVLAAQNNPRTAGWGKPSARKPLIREYLTRAEQRKKRSQVCGQFSRNDSSDSCDEYPYSSTRQGIPQYAVTEHVSLDQNSNAGTTLSRFYADYHIVDGDPFYVAPCPREGWPACGAR